MAAFASPRRNGGGRFCRRAQAWRPGFCSSACCRRDVRSGDSGMTAPLDCLVVGAGPAGLTAAIYLARFHLRIAIVDAGNSRSEEHTSELQSLMRISYAVFCLKKKKQTQ